MKNKNLSGNIFTKESLRERETSLSARIADYLTKCGIYNDRLNCGVVETVKKLKEGEERRDWLHLCKTGTPDRFCIVRGYIVFIEVKRLGEKPAPEQIKRHEELRRSGAIVLVVDSFESFLKQFSAVHGNVDFFK
jgi:hypothetical protein